MDFLFGSSDLSTPIGQVVKAATDPLLIRPDWEKNMDICEMVKSTADGSDLALRAISRRLQDSDQNTVYLALIVAETCMKNVGLKFAGSISKSFMDLLVGLARGSKGSNNANESLRIIQEWGREYEDRRGAYPLFFDTYMTLRSRGFQFPPETAQRSGDNPVQNSAPAGVPASASYEQYTPSSENELERLRADLNVVMDKVKLCRQMLFVTEGIRKDELLAEVVGYLEACRDRMTDLIEAGTQGILGEVLFEECLKVNDAILRTLEAEKNGKPIGIEDDDKETGMGEDSKQEEANSPGNLLDLGESPPKPGEKGPPVAAPAPAPSANLLSAAEDDIFGSMPAKTVGGPKVQPQKQPIPIPGQNGVPLVVPSSTNTSEPSAAPAPAQFDPFGNAPSANPFDEPLPAPPQQSQKQEESFTVSSSTNNAFDPFNVATPPGVHGAGNDDLDFLNNAGSTNAAPASGSNATPANANEFDDFFESLK